MVERQLFPDQSPFAASLSSLPCASVVSCGSRWRWWCKAKRGWRDLPAPSLHSNMRPRVPRASLLLSPTTTIPFSFHDLEHFTNTATLDRHDFQLESYIFSSSPIPLQLWWVEEAVLVETASLTSKHGHFLTNRLSAPSFLEGNANLERAAEMNIQRTVVLEGSAVRNIHSLLILHLTINSSLQAADGIATQITRLAQLPEFHLPSLRTRLSRLKWRATQRIA